jgi:hypothetical protein
MSLLLLLCQVLNKQVVTRTSGRSLGTISGAWLDPARGTLVSFDLDDRRPGSGSGLALSSPARAGNIPLSALRQVTTSNRQTATEHAHCTAVTGQERSRQQPVAGC